MTLFFRGAAAAVAALAALFLGSVVVSLVPGMLLEVPGLVGAWAAAFFAGRWVWRATVRAPEGLAMAVGMGALLTGGVGFAAGFFGPMVFAPDANQGPLLGIFITGPLGFVVGAVGGAVYWLGWGRRLA